MLSDITRLTELYLHAEGLLPENESWWSYHRQAVQTASLDQLKLLVDANIPADFWVFVDLDLKKGSFTVVVKEAGNIPHLDRPQHLFWQGSGGSQSDAIRNTPHKLVSKKNECSITKVVAPLRSILERYCQTTVPGKNEKQQSGPLFWNRSRLEDRKWLEQIVNLLGSKREELDECLQREFPSLKSGQKALVVLTIGRKPIGEWELFRRYLIAVRMRAGISGGASLLDEKEWEPIAKQHEGLCPLCKETGILLDQWTAVAELSCYQLTDPYRTSYQHRDVGFNLSSFKLCRTCTDLLYVFKQRLLKALAERPIGGNECLILPSIKLVPMKLNDRRALVNTLKDIWGGSMNQAAEAEQQLLYRLGQLPSYATVSFVFGDAVTTGETKNVRRLDKLNVVFPDVLPSRILKIAEAITKANQRLDSLWALVRGVSASYWKVDEDLFLLHRLFAPSWEEKKRSKSKRRAEVERYLRAIFYGEDAPPYEIASDAYENLVAAYKRMRDGRDEKAKYSLSNFTGNILALLVLMDQLRSPAMKDITPNQFPFSAMPELGQFIDSHPLLRDGTLRAPFVVGCLFAYAEHLQKPNTRLAAYTWLGTLTLRYDDILQGIYPRCLEYIKTKEKFIDSQRLQELMKAICHYDVGRVDHDRAATVAFCHGWAVGRDFIFKKKTKPEGGPGDAGNQSCSPRDK
jgi:hypothetical protein